MSEEVISEVEKYKVEYTEKEWGIAGPLLSNAQKYSNSSVVHNGYPLTTDQWMQLTNKIIKKILILLNIVQIQPLVGPVGQVFYLQVDQENPNSFSIVSDAVQAKSERFFERLHIGENTKITEQALDDYAAKIADALIENIINSLRKNAYRTNYEFTQFLKPRIEMEARYIKYKSTRRIPQGNYVILSKKNFLILFKNSSYKDREVNDSNFCLSSITYKCFWESNMKDLNVLITDYVGDDIIVGYSDTAGIDSSFIFCPYVLCMSTGVVLTTAENAKDMSLGTMTRYGLHIIPERVSKYCTVFKLIEEVKI